MLFKLPALRHVGLVLKGFECCLLSQVTKPAHGSEPAQHLVVYVELISIFSDYRGLAMIVGPSIKQAPAAYACFKSWHHGKFIPGYKMIYLVHAK